MWTFWKRKLHSLLPYAIKRKFTANQVGRAACGAVAVAVALLVLKTVFSVHRQDDLRMAVTAGGGLRMATAAGGRRPVLSALHGVEKKSVGHYSPDGDNMFRCIKTSSRIPFEQVNDDFCDCPLDDDENFLTPGGFEASIFELFRSPGRW